MQLDALTRRLRFAPPQPHKKRCIILNDGDLDVFAAIRTHGPLPTNYLHEFRKHRHVNYKEFQHRLTDLFNGAANSPGHLSRPPQQFLSFYARYQPMIYDLTERGERVLAEYGRLPRYAPRRTDPFLHRFMSACVSASFELVSREMGHDFIPMERIFEHEKCRRRELSLPVSGFTDARAAVPDNLFGIRYKDGKHRFYAVEIDRNTESIERRMNEQNTFAKKIRAYLNILENRTYRSEWGVTNLRVLTITTNANHVKNLIDYLAKQPGLTDRFLFQAYPDFGTNWSVPRQVLASLLSETWDTTAGPIKLAEI